MICLKLFLTFLKIGTFTFGGGYAMLPLIEKEVISQGWMDLEQLVNFIAVSESTPGPFAVNISTYIGMETAGFAGACCATFGVVLPSFLIIVIIAKLFDGFSENKYVKGCMSGLRPAVVGMIASAVISVGSSVFFAEGVTISALTTPQFIISVMIFVLMLILAFMKKHPILIILLSAVLGIIGGCLFI